MKEPLINLSVQHLPAEETFVLNSAAGMRLYFDKTGELAICWFSPAFNNLLPSFDSREPLTLRPCFGKMNSALFSKGPSGLLFDWYPRSRPTLATCTVAAMVCTARLAGAQEGRGQSMAGDAVLEGRAEQLENRPYTFKSGDFRFLAVPSMGMEWNDNVNLSKDHALDDYILSPMLQMTASYPVTRRNLLQLSVGVGYDQYLKHDEYSGVRLRSGSELSFDLYVKDFWINLHDRFQYTQDAAGHPDVAGSGFYGGLDNTVGLSTTWDLNELVLNLGYDHENFVASTSQFAYDNRATELVSARGGYRFTPRLTAGLEGSVAVTAYEQPFLNNNVGYNAGVYAEWQPGSYFQVKPRFGYTIYDFSQTSRFIRAVDQDAWYADLTLTHAITEAVSYSLSGGHELRLGVMTDAVEDWYVRSGVSWSLIKNLTLNTSFSYENGRQGAANVLGNFRENYDWFSLGAGLSHALTKRLALGLNYRLTLRSSNVEVFDYSQNVVDLSLVYQLQ